MIANDGAAAGAEAQRHVKPASKIWRRVRPRALSSTSASASPCSGERAHFGKAVRRPGLVQLAGQLRQSLRAASCPTPKFNSHQRAFNKLLQFGPSARAQRPGIMRHTRPAFVVEWGAVGSQVYTGEASHAVQATRTKSQILCPKNKVVAGERGWRGARLHGPTLTRLDWSRKRARLMEAWKHASRAKRLPWHLIRSDASTATS